MTVRLLKSIGFCIGVEVTPMYGGRALVWALHLGRHSLALTHAWWL